MSENEFIYNSDDQVKETLQETESEFVSYSLVGVDDPILTTKLKDFDFGNPTLDSIEIANRLIKTAKTFNSFSVAGNQCGLPHKVFVAGNAAEYVAFYNPVIIDKSTEVSLLPETDLSNFGLILHINRPKSIVVEYQDFDGKTKMNSFDGLTARIIQQNIDRLNGIDFKSKVSKFNLERKQKAFQKKVKKFVRNNVR